MLRDVSMVLRLGPAVRFPLYWGGVVTIASLYFEILRCLPKITSRSAICTWEKRDASPPVGVESADVGNINGTCSMIDPMYLA